MSSLIRPLEDVASREIAYWLPSGGRDNGVWADIWVLIADLETDDASEVLDLLAKINAEQRMSVLFISHDLLSVAALCHRLAILHEGVIVECGPVRNVIDAPVHPYTKQLIAAIPRWV